MRELTFDEIEVISGADSCDAINVMGNASSVLGVVSAGAGIAAFVPGPHSLAAGAISLGSGVMSLGLLGASQAIGRVTGCIG